MERLSSFVSTQYCVIMWNEPRVTQLNPNLMYLRDAFLLLPYNGQGVWTICAQHWRIEKYLFVVSRELRRKKHGEMKDSVGFEVF